MYRGYFKKKKVEATILLRDHNFYYDDENF